MRRQLHHVLGEKSAHMDMIKEVEEREVKRFLGILKEFAASGNKRAEGEAEGKSPIVDAARWFVRPFSSYHSPTYLIRFYYRLVGDIILLISCTPPSLPFLTLFFTL